VNKVYVISQTTAWLIPYIKTILCWIHTNIGGTCSVQTCT